ncbi:MAG: hypothetical protein AAF703_01275 [Cyanobacteria bacterium P01_D01_bin.105]
MRKSDRVEPNNFEPDDFEPDNFEPDDFELDGVGETGQLSAERSHQLNILHEHKMQSWWRLSLALWLTIGLLSLWALRAEFQELYEYFTWAAIRAMLAFNRLPALGLGICFGLTIALLYAESRHILFGLSKSEKQQLITQLNKIQAQGTSHPQWKLIHRDKL